MRLATTLLLIPTLVCAADNVIGNGDFAKTDDASWKVWGDPARVSYLTENNNRFLRVDTSAKKGDAGLFQEIEIRPDWSAVKVSVRIRVKKLAPQDADDKVWNRPILHFLTQDESGKNIGKAPWSKIMVEAEQDWKTYTEVKEIAEGSAKLRIEARILGAAAIADYDDVVVEPVIRQP